MARDVATARRPAAGSDRAGAGRAEPGEILARLRALDPDLHEEAYYSERALFYNPGRAAPLGAIFAAIKDHDGPNDARSRLFRPGVFGSPSSFLARHTWIDSVRFHRGPPRAGSWTWITT